MKNYIILSFAFVLFLLAPISAFTQATFFQGPRASVNVNDSVVLRLNDYEGSIQWQESVNLNLWDNLFGATEDTLLIVAESTRFYRAKVTAGDCEPFYSDTIFIMVFGMSDWQRDTVTEVVEVLNPSTGRIWMDRNLGATRVATNINDELAFGDLYQWGRAADGHQKRTSANTYVLSDTDTPGHGDFIVSNSFPLDWRSPQSFNLWQGEHGINNPCPEGFRVPTESEWIEERESWGDSNAFESLLKLPNARYRHSHGFSGYGIAKYWSSTVNAESSRILYGQIGHMQDWYRAAGISVRCIKNIDDPSVTYSLDLQGAPGFAGKVFGSGEYPEGASVIIAAIPNENYRFVTWFGNTKQIIDHNAAIAVLVMPAHDVQLSASFTNEGDGFFFGDGVTDVQGNFYPSVIMGNQEWTTQNLRTSRYNDNTDIPHGLSNTEWEDDSIGAFSVYPYSLIPGLDSEEDVLDAYGKVYNHHAVQTGKLCPAGWRVPSDADWNSLIFYLGGHGFPLHNSNDSVAALALRSCRQVNHPAGGECDTSEHPRWDQSSFSNGFDEFGFSGLPAGGKSISGSYSGVGIQAVWWSSTIFSQTNTASYRSIFGGSFLPGLIDYNTGLSVRCIKGEETLSVVSKLNLSANPLASGLTSCGGEYEEGEIITISVMPDANYQFMGWSGDIEYVADKTSLHTTLVMPGYSIWVYATFEPLSEPCDNTHTY